MIGEDLNMAVPFEKMSSISEIHRVAASTLCPGGELIKVDGRASDCLVCILSGATEYDFGFKVERAEAGELLYLARGSVYTMNVLEEYSVIFADFDFSTGDERAGSCGTEKLACSDGEARFRRMLSSWRSGSDVGKLECYSLLYGILAAQLKGRSAYINSELRQRLGRVEKYISDNYMKEITVGELAKLCSMSEGYFRRSFERRYRSSPAKYIMTARLRSAAELLSYGNMTVTQISEAVGFSSVYYFSRAFKKEYGLTPSGFRNAESSLG